MRLKITGLLLLGLATAGCQSNAPNATPALDTIVVAGTNNQFFSAVSSRRVRLAEGAKLKSILGLDGRLHGVTIIARDNSMGALTCECHGACMPDSNGCKILVPDDPPTGSNYADCVGSCNDSEGTPGHCGTCTFALSGGGGDGGGHLGNRGSITGSESEGSKDTTPAPTESPALI
jgi:hypothetical protein